MNDTSGRFEMTSADNYEAYLKAVGVGHIMRNMALKATPTVEIFPEGDGRWRKNTLTSVRKGVVTFRLGERFTEDVEGFSCPSTISQDGDQLIQELHLGNSTATVTRTFTDTGMDELCEADGVTARRTFKRL
ncbi:lipocalin/fatty-acid binding family protein [Streptomyces sp. NPDC002886]|uniref:lipocalin/fatty-acid binding family protein n=1 Tax=Streptomyces sp. NPDC002886 TaxID=3364667 RepID=UPI0036B2FD43